MRAYVMTSGVVFGLVVLLHVARVVAEGTSVATHPGFILSTVVVAGLFLWAMRLLTHAASNSQPAAKENPGD